MTTSRPIFLFPFPEGYWDGNYYYAHYRDYQNAVRATAANGRSYADNHYYPYGVPFSTSTDFGNPLPDRRLYGDKEMLTFLGYNTYDYSARHYFSPAASFDTPDPKAHDYTWISPYTFCAGNPVMYTDPTGERLKISSNEDLNYLRMTLPPCVREYVVLSEDNFINEDELANGINQSGNISQNLQCLNDIVQSNYEVLLNCKSFEYSAYDTELQAIESMSFSPLQYDDEFQEIIDNYNGDPSLLINLKNQLISVGILPGLEGFGKMGATLLSAELSKPFKPKFISTSSVTEVYLNGYNSDPSLFAIYIAHELYGHVYFAISGFDSRHSTDGQNMPLERHINQVENETKKYLK